MSTSASVPIALKLIGILSRFTVLVPMQGTVTGSKGQAVVAVDSSWSNGGAIGRSSAIMQSGEVLVFTSLPAWAESDILSDNGPSSCIYGR